ncbi:hypothetical protein GCM10027422_29680 [Hymenobacter arcticus]
MIRVSTCFPLLLLATLVACTEPADQATKAPATPTAAAPAPPHAALLTASYAGEYNWGDPKRKEAGGTLYVYPESDSTVLVALDVCYGPPAFHLGNLYRRAVVRRGVGRCAIRSEEDMLDCQLRLTFAAQAVVVATEKGHGECGFGQAVYADGNYRRTSSAVPQYFTDSSGKTFFKKTTPEQYNSAE